MPWLPNKKLLAERHANANKRKVPPKKLARLRSFDPDDLGSPQISRVPTPKGKNPFAGRCGVKGKKPFVDKQNSRYFPTLKSPTKNGRKVRVGRTKGQDRAKQLGLKPKAARFQTCDSGATVSYNNVFNAIKQNISGGSKDKAMLRNAELARQLESTEIEQLIGNYKFEDKSDADSDMPDDGDYGQYDPDLPEALTTQWTPEDKARLEAELAKQRKEIQRKDREIGKLGSRPILEQLGTSDYTEWGTSSMSDFDSALAKQRRAIEKKRREIELLRGLPRSENPWAPAVFSKKEKGRHINVGAGGRSAQNNHGLYSTVRAGVYVPRDGIAFATIKVDREGEVGIGVLTRGYTAWDDSKHVENNEALSYDCEKGAWNENPYESTGLPKLPSGMEIFVALSGGEVSFSLDCEEVHRFPLPKNCGPVTLGVTLKRAKVSFI